MKRSAILTAFVALLCGCVSGPPARGDYRETFDVTADTGWLGTYDFAGGGIAVIAPADLTPVGGARESLLMLSLPNGSISRLQIVDDTTAMLRPGIAGDGNPPTSIRSRIPGDKRRLLFTDGRPEPNARMRPPMRRVSRPFASDSIRFAAELTARGASYRRTAVLLVPGSGAGTRDYLYFGALRRALAEEGFVAYAYDKRGSGATRGGSATNVTTPEMSADVAAAMDTLRASGARRVALIGLSQGGWVSPLASTMRHADCLVLFSAPAMSTTAQELHTLLNRIREAGMPPQSIDEASALWSVIERVRSGEWPYDSVRTAAAIAQTKPWWQIVRMPTSAAAIAGLQRSFFDPTPTLRELSVPVTVLLGREDRIVPIEDNLHRWQAVSSMQRNVEVKVLEGDHALLAPATHPFQGTSMAATWWEATLSGLRRCN